ncbi:MAG TPA: HD domain-containing protein [Pyrinomonadaceae bacterium]|nr:HD domain-containing protein [Pyrinomonadaceae bacterium]
MKPANRHEALALLCEVGAPPRLYRHAELVGEAADLLLAGLKRFGVQIDEDYVRVGVVLHDAGKSLHTSELFGPGNNHEADGERLLLSHGATPEVARVCRSHAQWDTVAETLEELLIALSDKLWKGVRVAKLEELVIDRLAESLQKDRWDCFTELDILFEDVAETADGRLARSDV